MTSEEIRRMRNPLSARNVERVRKLLRSVDFNLVCRSHTMTEVENWFHEERDELSSCRAILEEWKKRRGKEKNNDGHTRRP